MHEEYMRQALDLAREAAAAGEVPVGCVIVDRAGQIIGRGRNRREEDKSPLAHAELAAITDACRSHGDWRLKGARLYVTLEPCPMCMGAALNARIDKLFFGAYEQKGRSLTNELAQANLLNHTLEIQGGVAEKKCSALLTDFFSSMRRRTKEEKERRKLSEEGKFPENNSEESGGNG